MPEFDFSLSDSEISETLEYIFDLGGYIQVPEFASESVRYIHTKVAFKYYFESAIYPRLDIFHKEYFVCPMPTKWVMRHGRKMYYACDRIGGPSIIFSWFKLVNQGICTYYPTYYCDDITYEKFRPNQTLIDFYKSLFKFIRKKSVIIKYYNRRIYCGREYIRQVMEGTAKFEIKDEFKAAIMEQMKDKLQKEK